MRKRLRQIKTIICKTIILKKPEKKKSVDTRIHHTRKRVGWQKKKQCFGGF